MNIGPALKKQKVMIGTALGLMAIILLGSLIVSRNKIVEPKILYPSPTSETTQDITPDRTLNFYLESTALSDTQVRYYLKLSNNTDILTTVGFQLQISGATAVSSQNKTFTSEESLASQGWQTVGTQSSQSQSSTISFGLVQLLPDKTEPTGDIVLGEFTVELAEAGVMPEFVLDQAKSEAITVGGERLQARLVIADTVYKVE